MGIKISEMYSGDYLKADDFTREGENFTIAFADMDKVGKDDKLVLHFTDREDEKVLPLNKTNALELAEMFGDDTDDWAEKEISIRRDMTTFQGKRIACARIGKPKSNGSGSGSGKSK